MPDNGHRDQHEIEREIAQRRAHLGESVQRLQHLAREKLDVRARARVAVARGRQQVKVHPWPILAAALAFGVLFAYVVFRPT